MHGERGIFREELRDGGYVLVAQLADAQDIVGQQGRPADRDVMSVACSPADIGPRDRAAAAGLGLNGYRRIHQMALLP